MANNSDREFLSFLLENFWVCGLGGISASNRLNCTEGKGLDSRNHHLHCTELEFAPLYIHWSPYFTHYTSPVIKLSPIKGKKLNLGNCFLSMLLQEHQLLWVSPNTEEKCFFVSRSIHLHETLKKPKSLVQFHKAPQGTCLNPPPLRHLGTNWSTLLACTLRSLPLGDLELWHILNSVWFLGSHQMTERSSKRTTTLTAWTQCTGEHTLLWPSQQWTCKRRNTSVSVYSVQFMQRARWAYLPSAGSGFPPDFQASWERGQ